MSDALHDEAVAPAPSPAAMPWTRLFYWSVRREVWENRAVYIAPLAAVGVALLGVLVGSGHLVGALRAAMADPKKVDNLMMPYSVVAFAVLVTGLIFGAFYCLAALHGERRDRSILFWKSLPVSDLTTVLSKAAIPMLVLPPIMIGVAIAGHLGVLALTSLVVLVNGINPMELWTRLNLGFMWAAFIRGMIFLPLWFAPVSAWMMLVSAWAKRMPILWALGPVIAVSIIERMAFGKAGGPFSALFRYRFGGWFTEAFTVGGKGKTPIHHWADLDPTSLLINPWMWAGLVVAVLFLALAVRLRRAAEPI